MSGFTVTGGMSTSRELRSAALLADGRVLVAGGRDSQGALLLTAEIFDPQSGQWAATGSLNQPHEDPMVVAVGNDAALIGGDQPGQDAVLETWNSATERWTKTIMPPFMATVGGAWYDGNRLLVLSLPEGLLDDMAFRSIELPTKTVHRLLPPNTARHQTLNCQLSDGRILLTAGVSFGIGGSGAPVEFLTRQCEVYDPVAGAWEPVGHLAVPHLSTQRAGQSLLALPDGGALMVCGSNPGTPAYTDVVERWSSTTGVWDTKAPLTERRDNHTTSLLPDDTVLVIGGEGPGGTRSDCHIYDLQADSWSSADALTQPRQGHLAVALADGRVLVIDGARDGSCELYA